MTVSKIRLQNGNSMFDVISFNILDCEVMVRTKAINDSFSKEELITVFIKHNGSIYYMTVDRDPALLPYSNDISIEKEKLDEIRNWVKRNRNCIYDFYYNALNWDNKKVEEWKIRLV